MLRGLRGIVRIQRRIQPRQPFLGLATGAVGDVLLLRGQLTPGVSFETREIIVFRLVTSTHGFCALYGQSAAWSR
jgi:hypothetical protein